MIDDRGNQIDMEEKAKDPMGRFEIMAEMYMNGTSTQRELILSFFPDPEDRRIVMEGFGLYHLYRDQRLYNAVCDAIGQQIYEEAQKG